MKDTIVPSELGDAFHIKKDNLVIRELDDSEWGDAFHIKKDNLVIRELDDYEVSFFFNPSVFAVDINNIKGLLTRASLRTGVCGAELKNIQFGTFSIRFNPLTSNEADRRFVKNLFIDYFNHLEPCTI